MFVIVNYVLSRHGCLNRRQLGMQLMHTSLRKMDKPDVHQNWNGFNFSIENRKLPYFDVFDNNWIRDNLRCV